MTDSVKEQRQAGVQEIEITPEMVVAGTQIVHASLPDDSANVEMVAQIFEKMAEVSGKFSTKRGYRVAEVFERIGPLRYF